MKKKPKPKRKGLELTFNGKPIFTLKKIKEKTHGK